MTDEHPVEKAFRSGIQKALLEVRDPEDIPQENARLRLANALRAALQHAATSMADDDPITAAAALVEEAVRHLEPGPHGRPYQGSAEGSVGGVPNGFTSYSPVTGPMNALASVVNLSATDNEVIADVIYGKAYEGPPGHLHGGLVAAIFDEVLGFAQALSGAPGMTGKLEITYRAPTPLHTPLRVVGRYEKIEGRKIFATGTIHAGDRLCAEAKGIFISVRPEMFGGLGRIRDQQNLDG